MSQNGWKRWDKKSGGGQYSKYENRMVVIVSPSKSGYMYLSQTVMAALHNPEYVEVYTRGSNIALFPSDDRREAYKVTQFERGVLSNINPRALVKTWNISPGVYDAHIEDDHVVFDTQQKPSKI